MHCSCWVIPIVVWRYCLQNGVDTDLSYEAGNRCFDRRVPEEINRRIVDHTADVNLTYSTIARDYLLREGLSPDMVIKTGSPMFEVLEHYRDRSSPPIFLKGSG